MVIEEGDGWKDASWAGPAQETVAWLQKNVEMSTFLRTSSGLLCTENKLKVSSIVCTEKITLTFKINVDLIFIERLHF